MPSATAAAADPPGGMKRSYTTGISELWEFEAKLNPQRGGGGENVVEEEEEHDEMSSNGNSNSNSKPTVVLGVDGGATTTISICLSCPPHQSADPIVLSRAVTGSSNFNSVSEATAKWALEKSMAEALMKANIPRVEVKVVCLALSGVDVPADADRVLAWLKYIFPFEHTTCYVYNDAVAALASGTAGKKYGCVLIAGTGTIAYGFTEEGKVARSSGLGPLLGDQGSGHAIATNALIAVMRAHDGRGPSTRLTDAILGKLGLSSPEEIIRWVYGDTSWARVAALVPVVKACAQAGDEVAIGVLQHAVEELAWSVEAVVRTLNLNGIDNQHPFPFVMVGGVLEHEEGWDLCKPLISRISKAFPKVQAIRPNVEPAVGAALVAWRHHLEDKERLNTR
ncbi:unnamed protein product [Calypogeia fissa]